MHQATEITKTPRVAVAVAVQQFLSDSSNVLSFNFFLACGDVLICSPVLKINYLSHLP